MIVKHLKFSDIILEGSMGNRSTQRYAVNEGSISVKRARRLAKPFYKQMDKKIRTAPGPERDSKEPTFKAKRQLQKSKDITSKKIAKDAFKGSEKDREPVEFKKL